MTLAVLLYNQNEDIINDSGFNLAHENVQILGWTAAFCLTVGQGYPPSPRISLSDVWAWIILNCLTLFCLCLYRDVPVHPKGSTVFDCLRFMKSPPPSLCLSLCSPLSLSLQWVLLCSQKKRVNSASSANAHVGKQHLHHVCFSPFPLKDKIKLIIYVRGISCKDWLLGRSTWT